MEGGNIKIIFSTDFTAPKVSVPMILESLNKRFKTDVFRLQDNVTVDMPRSFDALENVNLTLSDNIELKLVHSRTVDLEKEVIEPFKTRMLNRRPRRFNSMPVFDVDYKFVPVRVLKKDGSELALEDLIGKRTVLRDVAGAGKTNFCRWICKLFAEGKIWTDKVDLVVHCDLNDLFFDRSISNKADFLLALFLDKRTKSALEDLKKWLKNHRVFWVFDNYDVVKDKIKYGTYLYTWFTSNDDKEDDFLLVGRDEFCFDVFGDCTITLASFPWNSHPKDVVALLNRFPVLVEICKVALMLEFIYMICYDYDPQDLSLLLILEQIIKHLFCYQENKFSAVYPENIEELTNIAQLTKKNDYYKTDANFVVRLRSKIPTIGILKQFGVSGVYVWTHDIFRQYLLGQIKE